MSSNYSIIGILTLPLLVSCSGASSSGPKDSLLAEELPTTVTESRSGDFLVDTTTELAWSTRISVPLQYEETSSYCASLGKGWRLPTIGELRTSLLGPDAATGTAPSWKKGLPDDGVLFSSEEIPRIDDQKHPMVIRINTGETFAGHGVEGYVRCVHGDVSREQAPMAMPPEPLLAERWWEQADACPADSVARGTVGRQVACVDSDGTVNGRSSTWTRTQRSDVSYQNEKLHGPSLTWHADGLKASELNYRDGQLHGHSSYWHANGEKASESDYADGKLDGLDVKWRADGLKASELSYRNGELHGRSTYWFENGEKSNESSFANGKLNGKATKWRADGLVESEASYRNGELHGTSTIWYDNGEKASEASYASGKLNGKARKWRADGLVESEFNYRNGDLHGSSTSYYPDGEKASESTFANGKLHGKTTKWRADGIKESEMSYRNGELHGITTTYYANGEKATESTFADGAMSGPHQRWDEQGRLSERIVYDKSRVAEQLHYSDGEPRNGSVETKYPNGIVSYVGVFKDGHAQGKHYGYHPNGQPKFERNYNAKGIPSGRSVDWYPNGETRETSKFVQGALHGERRFFAEDGKVKATYHYNQGVRVDK